MGILDVDTINEVYEACTAIHPDLWSMEKDGICLVSWITEDVLVL